MSEYPWLQFLLQTSDALFPTGAYAHSLGFEEIVRLEVVKNEASLSAFLQFQLLPNLAQLELPYLRFAFELDANLPEIDQEISAWKLAHETRDASTQLGVRRLKALQSIHPSLLLENFSTAIAEGRASGHHLVVCALQAQVESVPLPAALTVYAYQSLAACCGAALKLIRIGQDGCQRVLREAARHIPETVAISLEVERENAGCFNPLLEIASMRHAFAGERLFIS